MEMLYANIYIFQYIWYLLDLSKLLRFNYTDGINLISIDTV